MTVSIPKVPQPHPLAQLTADEIKQSANLVRRVTGDDIELIFKAITLKEPDKTLILEYLEAEHSGASALPHLDRFGFVVYYKKGGVCDDPP